MFRSDLIHYEWGKYFREGQYIYYDGLFPPSEYIFEEIELGCKILQPNGFYLHWSKALIFGNRSTW